MATNEQREEAARLYHEMLAAQQRYEDYGVNVVVTTGEAAARCALTHQVLIESDEYLEDVETGDVVLRSAVGLAPRDQGED